MKKIKFISLVVIFIMLATLSTASFASVNNYAYAISGTTNTLFLAAGSTFAYSAYMGGGFDTKKLDNPSGVTLKGVLNLNPKIFYTIARSNYNQIIFEKAVLQRGSDIYLGTDMMFIGVKKYDWSNSSLVILTGSKTAANVNENIAYDVYQQMGNTGAVIGWPSSIDYNSAIDWTKYFNRRMVQGDSVVVAMSYANSYTYADNSIKRPIIYGNQFTKIINASRPTNLINNFDNRKHTISYDVYYNSENDLTNITNMLENEYTNFNSDNYEVQITSGPNGVDTIIDFTLKVGEFSTLSGYTVFINNNKVSEIYDNTTTNNDNNLLSTLSSNSLKSNMPVLEENYKNQSAQKLLNEYPNSTNTKQESKLFYDLRSNKKYIVITTTNSINGAEAQISDYYEIN